MEKKEGEVVAITTTAMTTPTTALTTETASHTNAHAFSPTHQHTHTLREAFTILRGHSMPYEPVLAPAGVTSDSTSSVSEDSGFRHYLRKVSSLGTPAQVTSTIFIIPRNEVVNDQVFSKSYDSAEVQEWKHPRWREYTPVDRTSLTDPSSTTNMATATLTTSTMITTESGFQDVGLSSSTISSSIESPRSTSVEHVEDEPEEIARHPRHSTTYQLRSQNLQPRSGQVITSWFQKIFRRKESEGLKDPQNSIPARKRHLSAIVSSHEHRPRRQSASHAEKQPEQKVVSMRSIEVSASESSNTTIVTEPTVHFSLQTAETALHTTCLQTTCEETNHIPPSSNEVANPLIVMRVGRVETAAWPTTSRSWAGSGYSPQQCTSVVSVFSNLNVSTPKYVNWENKSTSPFTILPTFSEEFEKKVEKQPSVGDGSYLYHNDSDPTRPSARVYLESDTYLQQSDDSMLVESECFYEPINKKLPCRGSQNECSSRSSQSTPVCIARCQSFVASRSSKNSINECDSGKVDSKFTLTQIRSDVQDDGSSLKDEESKLKLLPDEKNLVAKTVAQLPLSPTPGHQRDRDGAEGQEEEVQKKSPVGRRKHSAIKTAPAFERSSIKLAVRTPPSVVFRRNRDIANGVQSPLSPHPVEIKTRISSLDELSTALHINNKEGGKFIQSVNRTGSYSQHRKWSLGGRLYPPRDVDSSGDFGEPIQLTVVPLVKNSVNKLPEDIYKIRRNSTPVKRGSNTQDLQERCKTLDSFTDTVTPATQPISNAPPGDIKEKKCILSTSVGKPVAKVQPSTVPQGGRNFVESNKIKAIPSVKSHAIYFNSNVNGTKKVQLQEQVDTKEISGETSTSVKVNGLAKPAEEISTIEKTSNSKNHKISFKVTKDFETSSSNSTQSLATSVSDGPEKGLIQIVSPTIQESQVYAVETQGKPSQISSESTLQVAFQNEGSSILCYPKINVSRLPQTRVKQQESLNKAPLSRDPPAASILSSRPSDLQPPDPVGKRNQTTPTSSTGQHFFPKTHQVPQLSTGTVTANHGRGVREDVDDLQEDTLKSSRTSTLTPSSASPIRPTKLTRGVHVTKRPQTARILRTDESAKDFFLIPADTHKDAKPEDHFTIFEDIGKGKFGKVMRCENKQTHKIMAMKEIKTDRLPRHVSGDIMEVAVLRAIGRHDNIACFFSAYEVQHACFIITEYVCGGALYDRVVAEDNLDEKISASIIRQMLLGLEHIQACSVLHLDLKPENVMMVAPSGYQLKIIDFGLAYFYDPKRPRRQMGGTYIYSAPETINYDYQSFATDIWSVGVIAYELLSGITPFECPQSGDLERELTLPEITTNILNCRYNFDDDGICDASDKAKDFIRTILKKNPKDRPSVEACLKHPWMEMSDELPTVRRAVSIRRRASAKEKTRPFEISQLWIATDDAVY